jgi:hypothetical protein
LTQGWVPRFDAAAVDNYTKQQEDFAEGIARSEFLHAVNLMI